MKTFLAILAFAFATVAHAQRPQVTSIGDYDCGQWFSKNSVARVWLMGYLSGLAAADTSADTDALAKLHSADQAFFWMDDYCKKNPLKNLSEGAVYLYIELERNH